jgi:membrane protein implicated in regulation of membrane protease activity
VETLIPASAAGWWALAGFSLLILELLLPGVFLIWIGIAALLLAALLLGVWLPLLGQGVLFAGLSLVTVAIGCRWYRRSPDPGQGALRLPAAQMVGRPGVVIEAIAHGRGKVKVGDTVWLAEGPALHAGAAVTVVAQHGTVLTVQRAA